MKIVVWQPVLTDHCAYTLMALKMATKCELEIHVLEDEHRVRRAQGWTPGFSASLGKKCIPNDGWLAYYEHTLDELGDAVHLFGSPFERWRLGVALWLALRRRLKVYLVSEPYSPISAGYLHDDRRLQNMVKASLRPLAYRLYGRLLRRRLTGVFAISSLAVRQYVAIGVPRARVYPFGYFVPRAPLTLANREPQRYQFGRPMRIVCIAGLIRRKGILDLVAAAALLRRAGVRVIVDVFGPGDPSQFGFDGESVSYRGVIPFGHAQAVIREYDCLVLPSHFDGWGVVVNEALLVDVPVVCGDGVGAGAVARKFGCGLTFQSGNVSELARAIRGLFEAPLRLEEMRVACAAAARLLKPEVAGEYMAAALARGSEAHQPLVCPWYDS